MRIMKSSPKPIISSTLTSLSCGDDWTLDNLAPFETGTVPDKLKLAKVVPLFKGGDSSMPSNYRPISLLSIFDKLLEKNGCAFK